MSKILFVTGNFGITDKIPNVESFGNNDFYMFTDNEKLYKKCGWDIKKFKKSFNSSLKENVLNNRYIKFQLHKLMDLSKYAMVVYCDGYMFPKKSNIWNDLIKCVNENHYGLVQKIHRRDIYSECEAIHINRKEKKQNMIKLKDYLKSINVPLNTSITENTAFCYNPGNDMLLKIFDEFWELYIKLNITYRDQPLWGYILYKNKVNVHSCSNLFENFHRIKVYHKYV
tara:strand:+ start:8602 stop:9282 length:681 start_codon:yes stop_codon:yes gene_type:complete